MYERHEYGHHEMIKCNNDCMYRVTFTVMNEGVAVQGTYEYMDAKQECCSPTSGACVRIMIHGK